MGAGRGREADGGGDQLSGALPLAGLRVLDLTQVLAGPYCTMMLGDLGADVVKVERPGEGDGSRRWGPPFEGGESAYFMQVNRNKRSIAVDLRDDAGREVVRRLIGRCDVLLHNFLPAAALRYEVDWEAVRAVNPLAVHCTIAGYPSDGPDAERPGYDFLMQGLGGIMSITGEPDGEPMKVAVAISDIVAGLFASSAVLAALHERERSGQGRSCEVSLLDAQVAWLANRAGDWLISGIEPKRLGNAHPSIVPYETFRAADGYVNLAVGTDDHFRRFCAEAGRGDLATDPRWQTNAGRVEGRDVLVPQLRELLAGRTVAEWSERAGARARAGRAGAVDPGDVRGAGGAHGGAGAASGGRRDRAGALADPLRGRPAGQPAAAAAAGRARRRGAGRAGLRRGRDRRAADGRLQASLESALPARMWRNW